MSGPANQEQNFNPAPANEGASLGRAAGEQAATAARETLSNQAVTSMEQGANSTVTRNAGESIIQNGHANSEAIRVGEGSMVNEMKEFGGKKHGFFKEYEVTDKDREAAKQELAEGLSDLIPEADREVLKNMQSALIDGDLDKFKEALKGLSGDPEKLDKFLKAINKQFAEAGVFGGGLELQRDGQGNVLVHRDGGSTAVSINPSTGETTLRAIEQQPDGTTLVKPGEVIGRTPQEVMQDIGDAATRSVHPRWNEGIPKVIKDLPRGGGGGNQGDRQPIPPIRTHPHPPTQMPGNPGREQTPRPNFIEVPELNYQQR